MITQPNAQINLNRFESSERTRFIDDGDRIIQMVANNAVAHGEQNSRSFETDEYTNLNNNIQTIQSAVAPETTAQINPNGLECWI